MTFTLLAEGFSPISVSVPDESLVAFAAAFHRIPPEQVTPQLVYQAGVEKMAQPAREIVTTYPPQAVRDAEAAARAIAETKRLEWMAALQAVEDAKAAALAAVLA